MLLDFYSCSFISFPNVHVMSFYFGGWLVSAS